MTNPMTENSSFLHISNNLSGMNTLNQPFITQQQGYLSKFNEP